MNHRSRVAALLGLAGCAFALGCSKEPNTSEQLVRWGPEKDYTRHDASNAVIKVGIAVSDQALLIDPKHPPTQWIRMARIRNKGNTDEAIYKLHPAFAPGGGQAEYYYLFVGAPNGKLRWMLNGNNAQNVTIDHQEGKIIDCADGHVLTAADVRFDVGCYRRHVPAQASVNHASMFGGHVISRLYARIIALFQANDTAQGTRDDPHLWVACTDGCCSEDDSGT